MSVRYDISRRLEGPPSGLMPKPLPPRVITRPFLGWPDKPKSAVYSPVVRKPPRWMRSAPQPGHEE
jgi:hypothetical protein